MAVGREMKQQQIRTYIPYLLGLVILVFSACSGGDSNGGDPAPGGGDTMAGEMGDNGGDRPGPSPGGDAMGGSDMSGGVNGMAGAPSGGTGGDSGCTCPRELTCDAEGARVEANPCERDAQCKEGNICEAGECIAGCADDSACRMLSAGTDRCVDARCVECGEDDHCPGNTTCDADTKTCVEGANCTESADCLTGRTCVDGACQGDPRCPMTPCLEGRTCQMATGLCIPNTDGPCETNRDCVDPFVCVGEGIRARCGRCMADSDCGPGNTCEILRAGNRCAEPSVCESSDQCACSSVF